MAFSSEQTSSMPKLSMQKTPAEGEGWLNWMLSWNAKENAGTQLVEKNTGSTSNDFPRMDGSTVAEVNDGIEEVTERLLHARNLAIDEITTETRFLGNFSKAVGGEMKPLRQDHWDQSPYFVVNGELKQHNVEEKWPADDRCPENLKNWKFELNPRNMMMSQVMSAMVDRNSLAKEVANMYPDTDDRITLSDDMTTMLDRKKEKSDLEKATKDIDEWKEKNSIMAKELAYMTEMHQHNLMEKRMKYLKAAVQNEQAKYDMAVEQLNDDTDKFLKQSTSRFNNDEWKKEEDMFIIKELCMLRENVYRMEERTKTIDDSMSAQNVKLNKTIEKLQACTENVSTTSTDIDPEYKTVYNRLDKLEKTVNTLKSEKRSLIRVNRKITKEIKSYKRKYSVSKQVFNSFRRQMKNDLDDVKRHLHSIETTKNRNTVDRHKYDKLKLRLTMVEKAETTNQMKVDQMLQSMMVMSCQYSRCGRNESMANVHYDAKMQRPNSPHSSSPSAPSPHSSSPSAPSPPSIPPPPPFQPPASKAGPSSQYSRYTINSDILKAMTKELRKPDGNSIRKIPRRQDMKIPSKTKATTELEAPLPSLALTLTVEPTKPSEPAQTSIAPESPVEPPVLSEIPPTTDSESHVEAPEPQAPAVTSVAPESSPVEPLEPSAIPVTIHQESRVEPLEPPAPAITLVAPEPPTEPPPSEIILTDSESDVELPE